MTEKIALSYDKKNAINLVLGSFWASISATLTIIANIMRTNQPLHGSYIIVLGVQLGAYALFIGIRWYYYNSRAVGHLPMFSPEDLSDMVQKEIKASLGEITPKEVKKEVQTLESKIDNLIQKLEPKEVQL